MSVICEAVSLDRNLTVKRAGEIPACEAIRIVVWDQLDGSKFIDNIYEVPTVTWACQIINNNRENWKSLGFTVSLETVV